MLTCRYPGGSARGETAEMLVHPEQGAGVPARGPTARAIGDSGEEGDREEGDCPRRNVALRALPPTPESESCSGISSDQALWRLRSI